jgi:hypothetical protein
VLSRAQVAPGRGHAIRRFWWGVTTWNGGVAAAWIALAMWRAVATGSGQIAVVAASGAGYLIVVGRLVVPGRAGTAATAGPQGRPERMARGEVLGGRSPRANTVRCRNGAAAAAQARQEA